MNGTSITPNIGVTIGRHTRLYYAYITTAPAALDAPSTMTLYTAPLADVSGLACDEIVFDTCRARTKARLMLVPVQREPSPPIVLPFECRVLPFDLPAIECLPP